MKKTFIFLSILFFSLQNNFIFSQAAPFGQLVISNCYQSVTTGSNNYRFLKSSNGGFDFKIKSTNPLDIQKVDIYKHGTNPGDDPVYLQSYNFDPTYNTQYIQLINPNNDDKLIIYPIYAQGHPWGTLGPIYMDFDEPEFNLFNGQNPNACIPLTQNNGPNNNNFYGFKLNLDGVCEIELNLKYSISNNLNTNDIGLVDGFKKDLTNESDRIVGLPIDPNYCDQNNPSNNQWSQKCVNFTLELKLKACNAPEEDCPELTFNKPVQLCCWCE